MPSLWDALRQYLRDAGPGGVLNPEVTPQGLLDTASLASAPVPIAGDIIGLLADANRMRDPSERTATNFGLMALGALPLVPSGLGKAKKALSKIDDAKRAKTKYEIAHEVAQRNAALPFEKGGLGLPPNNTAMDRARAMGFETEPSKRLYHGSRGGIVGDIDPSKSDFGFHAGYLSQAEKRLKTFGPGGVDYGEGANVVPLMKSKYARMLRVVDEGSFHADAMAPQLERMGILAKGEGRKIYDAVYDDWYARPKYDEILREALRKARYDGIKYKNVHEGVGDSLAFVNPSVLRSRFAAFDPMKRDSADLLASISPYAITGGLLGLLGLPDDAQAGK